MAGRTDSESIRVPYRNLRREAEVEMMVTDEPHHRIDLNSPTSSSPRVPNGGGGGGGLSPSGQPGHKHNTLLTLILSCTVAAGVQFGWALQLSLLTPYIQTLGIGHAFSSFIWLCGPITGLVVQPCVGIWSDKCSLKLGRRRPFILAGSLMISVSVVLIGFSADLGYLLGDTKEHCSTFIGTRTRAAFVFIIGFWLLDLANNTVQGPARALLADLAGPEQRNTANAVFCSWMAVGNILGFSAGASGNWHRWFPFLLSRACCEACGNLKAAFLIAVIFLTLCTLVTMYFAEEIPLTMYQPNSLSDSAPLLDDPQQNGLELPKLKRDKQVIDNANGSRTDYERDINLKEAISKVEEDKNGGFNDGPGAVLVNLLTSLRHLPPAMHSVLIVMALTWLSWFPFFLFDTDWMGREVYHGDPKGNSAKVQAYDQGVREGAFGLLLNSVVLGISSFLIEPMCQRMGARLVWAMSNFIVFACMAGTTIISLISVTEYSKGIEHLIGGNENIRIASLIVFALLGFPLAITYSVPFSVTAELTADAGGGQDDCVSWCGAMGCFIWGRKYTCLCFGLLRCPCWRHYRSSQTTKSFEFLQVNRFSFWVIYKSSSPGRLMTGAAHQMMTTPYTIQLYRSICSPRDCSGSGSGSGSRICVRITLTNTHSINSFIFFFCLTSYVECILSVT